MLKPHVVVLGAGFGGTYVTKKLAKYVKKGLIDVTIVNKTNYFLFTPLLHEVATGSLSPTSVAEPLREVFSGTGVELCQGTVQSIDLGEHRVHISSSNGSRHTLPYDYLVISTGAKTNYYGISGAEKYTLPLKDLSDAVRIRTHVIDCFEEAIMCEDPVERARLLSFVVVGVGVIGFCKAGFGELNPAAVVVVVVGLVVVLAVPAAVVVVVLAVPAAVVVVVIIVGFVVVVVVVTGTWVAGTRLVAGVVLLPTTQEPPEQM